MRLLTEVWEQYSVSQNQAKRNVRRCVRTGMETALPSPVTCYEYMGEFYIVDGIKRVSIAKCHGLPTIPATVTRILPANTQTEAVMVMQMSV